MRGRLPWPSFSLASIGFVLFAPVILVACASTPPVSSEPTLAPGLDQSERIDAMRDDSGALDQAKVEAEFATVMPQLTEIRFLLVPGYLTDFLAPLETLGLSDYLQAQEAALRDSGLLVERAAINTLESVSTNARELERIVASSDRPVCLVTHSKGGVDVLVFLLTASEEARQRVACWLAFQAPFRGSPVADSFSENAFLQNPAHGLLWLFGGSPQSLEDLRTDVRRAFLDLNRERLANAFKDLPVLTVVAWVETDAVDCIRLRPIYQPLVWMRNLDLRSDGLVPTFSQMLPSTPYVGISGIDHTGAVSDDDCAALPFKQRKLLTLALLSQVFAPRVAS